MENRLPIDYVTKDYDGFLEMMKQEIPNLTPDWTDTSDSDQGIVILQLLSYGLHTLSYYQDKQMNENILHLAQTKKAILLLSKFLGYEIRKQIPATSLVRIYKDDTKLAQRVIVPKGTQFSTNPDMGESLIFETDAAMVIPEGEEYGDIEVTQGETVTREFLGLGKGTAGQKYLIENPFVIENKLNVVSEENGREYFWSLVDNFIYSTPSDRHFITELDEEDRTVVIFGDGISGMKPPFDVNIFANYRHGGGKQGNLAIGLINTIVDTVVIGIDSVTNIIPSENGEDYEDLEKVRTSAPKTYRTQGKLVTANDFEDFAESTVGVRKALCQETFNVDNDVNLYISTDLNVPAPQGFLDTLKASLNKIRVMNINLNVYNCLYKTVDLTIEIHVRRNFVAEDVKDSVKSSIQEFFESTVYEMGAVIFTPKIASRAFLVEGVDNSVIKSPLTDIVCAFNEVPKLGTITVTTVGGV